MDRRKFLGGAAALMMLPTLANVSTAKQIQMLKEKPTEELTKDEKTEIISYHLAEIAKISTVPLMTSYCDQWDQDCKKEGYSNWISAEEVWKTAKDGLPIIAVATFKEEDRLWVTGKVNQKMKD